MITNILLSCGFFISGMFVGANIITYALVKANDMYEEETGIDFISWVKQKRIELQTPKVYECEK